MPTPLWIHNTMARRAINKGNYFPGAKNLRKRSIPVLSVIALWGVAQFLSSSFSSDTTFMMTGDPPASTFKMTGDPWKDELFTRLEGLLRKCGVLCTINDKEAYQTLGKPRPGTNYSTFTTKVDCNALFRMEEIDAGDTTVPYPPPDELMPYYTLNGMIPLTYWGHLKNVYLGKEARYSTWSKDMIERAREDSLAGTFKGTYGGRATVMLRNLLQTMDLKSKHVLVVGTRKPWVEATALAVGAATVTTLEYGKIVSEHPQIMTYTPSEFRHAYLNRTLRKFDAVVSWSSVEHSGLGRYGDALNPWGDILSVARCWCATKENGLLLMGVPTARDKIEFNAHRIYGNIRWPLLTINWEPIDGTTDFDVGNGIKYGADGHIFRKISV